MPRKQKYPGNTRVCLACGQIKPKTDFYVYHYADGTEKQYSYCMECKYEVNKVYKRKVASLSSRARDLPDTDTLRERALNNFYQETSFYE